MRVDAAPFSIKFLHYFYTLPPSIYKFFRSFPLILTVSKQNLCGVGNGHRIYRRNRGVFLDDLRLRCRLQQAGSSVMNLFYVIGALASVGLLIYLVVALLKAEEL